LVYHLQFELEIQLNLFSNYSTLNYVQLILVIDFEFTNYVTCGFKNNFFCGSWCQQAGAALM